MTLTGPAVRRQVELGPEFPVEFERPGDEAHTWEWDDMHVPYALTPLAADYLLTLGSGMNDRYDWYGFPQRWRTAVWNGYGYFAFTFDDSNGEFDVVRERWDQLWRDRIDGTGEWWRTEVLPELRQLYERISGVDVDGLASDALAVAWTDAWEAGQRAWALHFAAIMGPYQAVEDLADLYESVTPGAPPSEAMALIQGHGDDLFAVELASESLAEIAASTPAVAARMRAGDPVSRSDLLELEGGPAFVARLDAFLAEHGHLGQPCDDFAFPSWIEDPGLYLTELAKRIDHPAIPAAERRSRLRAEADALADRTRERLADRPDELASFERALALARDIGPLTEGHNYWIDRMAQSRLRQLSMRIGRRLAAHGAIERDDDVLFLDRAEIGAALVAPRDLREVIAERRERHTRHQGIRPPTVVGKAPTAPPVADRFDGARLVAETPDELRGIGASPGIVRGPARVTLGPDDFGRIQPGDIIVCPSSNPSWVPVFAIAGGLVTNTGGVICHAAVVAREFGLPAVVGVADATELVADGRLVEIDGGRGLIHLL